ncbi:MAG: hypothetical protein NT141_02130 [candidate division WWE3 bacterium]|nr:hypothetical protein [candidate division WWE3 bacterium]
MEDKNIDALIKKINDAKKQNPLDLSSDEDLSIAIMNLVSIEEHLFFTAEKTNQPNYYDLLNEVREIRKSLLAKIVTNPKGEEWCISKHLLASSMRLMEVGTKQLSKGNKDEAYDLFRKAYDLYSMFWGINLKVIQPSEVKKIDETAISKSDPTPSAGFTGKLGDLVRRAINCCIE